MKILLIRLSSLGDIVISQAVTGELKRIYPTSELHYLCKPQFTPLVKLFGTVDKIIPYQKSLAFHKAMHNEHYDLIVDIHGKFASLLIAAITPHSKSLRYHKQRTQRLRIVKKHTHTGIDSTLTLYLTALSSLPDHNKSFIPDPPSLHVPDIKIDLPQAETLIVIFPGAAHQTKIYPAKQFSDFVKMLGSEAERPRQYHFLLLGSASESYLAAQIAQSNPGLCTNLCGKFSLEELVVVINRSDLVISNDSGPMHIAAALHKPQLAIFGATHPSLGFAPLNSKAKILVANLDCQPCSLHGGERCPRGDFRCMHTISPQILKTAVLEALAAAQINSSSL